jgi:hypothetical protein
MATNTGNLQHSLQVGLNAIIGQENRDYSPEWEAIYEVRSSTKNKEEVLLRSGMGTAFQTSEGGFTPMDSMSDEWVQTFRNLTYKLGFEITQEAVEDNQYQSLAQDAARELNRAFRHTKAIRAAAIFNNATSTSRPYKGGDGVALLSASHPLANGDTFSNFMSGMQLSESSLQQADIAIRRAVDDRGNRIMLKPKQLIIPAEGAWAAARLLQSDLRPGTNNNDINAIKTLGMIGKAPIVLTYLIDPDAWFVNTDQPKGFLHFTRAPFTFKTKNDENTGSYYGFGRERYSFGHADPRCVFGSMGS